METPDPQDTKSRRERGVIAQRAYRKRHATKFKQLQEENTCLRDSIQGIVAASNGHQMSPKLQDAISKARSVAELDDEEHYSLHQDVPEPEAPLAQSPLHERDEGRDDSNQQGTSCSGESATGLAPDNPNPPSSSNHYLGENMFRLEGRLFWDYMTYVMLQLQRHIYTDDRETLRAVASESEDAFETEFIISMGAARLEYHQSTKSSADPESLPPVLSKVAQKQRSFRSSALARNSDFWKTPEQAAEYLLQNLSPEDSETLLAAVSGKLSAEAEKNVGRRLYPFARNAVCFGDGPRWSRLFLSLAVGVWVSGSCRLDAYYDPETAG